MSKGSCIKSNNLFVDGKPFIIRGGEVQYFRLSKNYWRDRLEKARDCGMNTVTMYIPWVLHEPEEGRFDLTGSTLPDRDVKGFLEMAGDLGLKAIPRPGPFVNSEFRLGGLPEWLCKNHPDALSKRSDGNTASGRPCPAEGETVYRDFVRKWYEKVCPMLAELEIDKGGPVIMFQPDNELSAAWSFGLFNSLYDKETLNKRWPDWLREKYKTIEALHAHYENTTFNDFANVAAPRLFPSTPPEKRLAADWMNFKRQLFAEWGMTLMKWAAEFGITVPCVFNEPVAGFYGHGDHPGFGAELKKHKMSAVAALHTYSDRILDLDGVNNIVTGIEIAKSSPLGGPAISIESNAMWYVPRMNRSDLNWDVLLRIGYGRGLDGNVIYPFHEGAASLDNTIEGPEYFEPGAIDISGKPRHLFHALKSLNTFLGKWETQFAQTSVQPELAIAYTPGMRLTDFFGAPPLPVSYSSQSQQGGHNHNHQRRAAQPGGEKFSAEPAIDRGQAAPGHDWTDGYEGVSKQTVKPESGIWRKVMETALLCHRLNIAFEMRDLTNPNREPGQGLILVPNTGCLEREAVDYLLEHLRRGGKCVFAPTVPVFNTDGRQDARLLEMLDFRFSELIRPSGGETLDYGSRIVDYGAGQKLSVHSWVFVYSFGPRSTIFARHKNKPVAATAPAGNGSAIIIGFDPTFTNNASLKFWDDIIRNSGGVRTAVRVKGNFVSATLRKGVDISVLTVMNIGGLHGESKISVQGLPELTMDLRPLEARMLLINAACLGRRIQYATSEIVPSDERLSQFLITGMAGTKGEIAFDRPTRAMVGDKDCISIPENGVHVIRYTHAPDLTLKIIT